MDSNCMMMMVMTMLWEKKTGTLKRGTSKEVYGRNTAIGHVEKYFWVWKTHQHLYECTGLAVVVAPTTSRSKPQFNWL